MRSKLFVILAALSFVSCFITVGCSEKKKSPNAENQSNQTASIEKTVKEVVQAGNPNVPLDKYVELTSGNQLMFLYYGLINLPVDYENVAYNYSNDYRSTSDEFKKKDILNALKPRIDSELENAKANRYLKVEFDAHLGHYNFNDKAFPLKNDIGSNGYAYFADNMTYKYTFENGDLYNNPLKVSDESTARQIESEVNKFTPMTLVLYLYAQDADPNRSSIKCQIMKLKILDKNGHELISI